MQCPTLARLWARTDTQWCVRQEWTSVVNWLVCNVERSTPSPYQPPMETVKVLTASRSWIPPVSMHIYFLLTPFFDRFSQILINVFLLFFIEPLHPPCFSWFYSFPSLRPEWIAIKTFFPPTTTSFLWTKFPPKHYLTIPKTHLAGACNVYLQRAITHYSWMLQHSLAIGVASFPFRTENWSKLAFDFCHQKTKAGSEILLDSLQPQICISGLSAKLFFKATNNICLLFQPRVLLKMCSTPWTVAPTS